MVWPFRKRTPPPPAEEDVWNAAERNLIAQGVPAEKVRRASRLVKRYAREGLLPEGIVRRDPGPE